MVPYHASQMYSKNIITFLMHLLGKDGAKQPSLVLNQDDEITRETLLTQGRRGRPCPGEGATGLTRPSDNRTTMWLINTDEQVDSPFTFRILPGDIKTIGRAPRADFVVDAALVSRVHCRLTRRRRGSRGRSISRARTAPSSTARAWTRRAQDRRPPRRRQGGVRRLAILTVRRDGATTVRSGTDSCAFPSRSSSARRVLNGRRCRQES